MHGGHEKHRPDDLSDIASLGLILAEATRLLVAAQRKIVAAQAKAHDASGAIRAERPHEPALRPGPSDVLSRTFRSPVSTVTVCTLLTKSKLRPLVPAG